MTWRSSRRKVPIEIPVRNAGVIGAPAVNRLDSAGEGAVWARDSLLPSLLFSFPVGGYSQSRRQSVNQSVSQSVRSPLK